MFITKGSYCNGKIKKSIFQICHGILTSINLFFTDIHICEFDVSNVTLLSNMTYMCDVNMTSNQAENDAIIDVLCSPPSDRTKWRLGTQVCLYTEIMQIRLHKVPWNDRLSLWLILSPIFTEFVIWSTVALKCGLILFFSPFFRVRLLSVLRGHNGQ